MIVHRSVSERLRTTKNSGAWDALLETRCESMTFFRQRTLIPHSLDKLPNHGQGSQASHLTLLKAFIDLNFVNAEGEDLSSKYRVIES